MQRSLPIPSASRASPRNRRHYPPQLGSTPRRSSQHRPQSNRSLANLMTPGVSKSLTRSVRLMPDCCHHGEGKHDKRDMAMPAMPGAGRVIVESQFILGRLETILDRPAMTLDHNQGFDASSNRTPSGEEREVPISDVAAD